MMRRAALPALVLLIMAAPAQAYVPPGDKIIKSWITARERDAAPHTVKGTVRQGTVETPIQVNVTKTSIELTEGGRQVTDAVSLLVCTTLLRPSLAIPQLKQAGLDQDQAALGRSNGRIAFTLGAPGENRPGTQVWIDRKWMVPLLLVLTLPGGGVVRVEYSDYDDRQGRFLPGEITVTRAGAVRKYLLPR